MKAKLTANKSFTIGEIDKRIYGSFVEHLGRCVYGGIYEPTHESANEDGFRVDVIELVKKLNVPIVRYPGGNFVSGYNWEDGTGDKSKRPRKVDLAWQTIETNQVGTDDFVKWADKVGSDVMMAVNLGTRGPKEALELIEYCNGTTDTHFANLRRKNGYDKPFGIKTWCLGNEMDGPWQTCGKSAEEYGRIAFETAKVMKWLDPTIELVACGSSNYNMETFGNWELTTLSYTYDKVDYISMHQYYDNAKNNTPDFLGRSVHLDAYIKSVAAICDTVKAIKHSNKTVNLSLDEWNIWYHSNGQKSEPWQIGPALLEDVYNFEDALLVGCILTTLHNNCDRVKMACMAQLVNVIAPIMTENGGAAWAQTIFYPLAYTSNEGRGVALKPVIECDSYETSDKFTVPFLSASLINNEEKREITVFAINRSLDSDMELDISLEGFDDVTLSERVELYHDDLKITNTKDSSPVYPESIAIDPDEKIILKKHSWNMLKFKY